MSNVWGSGGLFERAVANKLQNQSSNAEANMISADANMMNANTNLLGTQNDAFLKADKNSIDRFSALSADRLGTDQNATARFKNMADYSLGLRNAATNAQNANTNMYGAETARGQLAAGIRDRLPSPDKLEAYGLRTFSGAPFMRNPGANSVAPSELAPKDPTIPQYKKGGQVKAMACAKGGKIGDVADDEGRDTIDAKVRPGEYMLNPETVAHIGGGNYEEGVRNLNAIVRQATGKEPGPTRVGKSDTVGFAYSGSSDPRAFRIDSPLSEGTVLYGDREGTITTDPEKLHNAKQDRIYKNAAEARAQAAAAAEVEAAAAKGSFLNNAGAQGARFVKDTAIPAVKNTVGPMVDKAKTYVKGAANKALAPALATFQGIDNIAHNSDYYADESVPVLDKINQGFRDVKGPALGYVGSELGVGAAGVLAVPTGGVSVLAAPAAAAAGYAGGQALSDLVDDESEGLRTYRKTHPDKGGVMTKVAEKLAEEQRLPDGVDAVAGATERTEEGKKQAAAMPMVRDFDAEVAAKAAESAAKPAEAPVNKREDFRNFLMDQYKQIASTKDWVSSDAIAAESRPILEKLADMDREDFDAKKTAAASAATTRDRNADMLQKLIDTRFVDGEGNYDKAAAADFRKQITENFTKMASQKLTSDGKPNPYYGVNINDVDPNEIMAGSNDYLVRTDVRDKVNNAASGLRDGFVGSDFINPKDLSKREMSASDIFDPNSSVGTMDVLRSMVKNGDYDQVVNINRGGRKMSMPMSDLVRNRDGSINLDIAKQYFSK
jgi:hypothetical protein